jgi:plastocyanin
MRRFAWVLALGVALAPAAQARTAAPVPAPARCAAIAKPPGNKAKPHGGCRRMPGQRASVRAVVPMVAAGLEAAADTAPPADSPSGGPAPEPTPAARLGVTAREWSLVLSRSTLAAGRAIVQLKNIGEDAHNLRIESASTSLDVPLAESGEVQEVDGTLPAGDYKVYCSLPGHEAAGMRARLTVTP